MAAGVASTFVNGVKVTGAPQADHLIVEPREPMDMIKVEKEAPSQGWIVRS